LADYCDADRIVSLAAGRRCSALNIVSPNRTIPMSGIVGEKKRRMLKNKNDIQNHLDLSGKTCLPPLGKYLIHINLPTKTCRYIVLYLEQLISAMST
jgi:hypothetical protein